MRDPYVPEQASELSIEFLMGELWRISDLTRDQRYAIRYVTPEKPRAGQVEYADGTQWNPGSGEGLYRFNLAGAWVFVG